MNKIDVKYINKENKSSRYLLSFHQIIGGFIGLIYIIFFIEFVNSYTIIPILCSILSIIAGFKLFKNDDFILLTQINYTLQIFSIYVYDSLGLTYDLPLSLVFNIELNEIIVGIDFYSGTHFDFYPDYPGETSFGINIVAAFILWFTFSEKGFRAELFDADPAFD